jgi:hypothetical protein
MGDTSTTYSEFWYDMMDLKSSDILNGTTQLNVYKDFVTNIYKHASDFKGSGIRGEEIEAVLNEIESYMKTVLSDESNASLVEYIDSNLDNAWTAYNAAYGSTSMIETTTPEEGE